MLSLKFVEEHPKTVIERLSVKNFDARTTVDKILENNAKRKQLQQDADLKQSELKQISKNIGQLFKEGKAGEANQAKEKTAYLKEQVKALTEAHDLVEEELQQLLVELPNLPHISVPVGKGAEDNIEVRSGGKMPALPKEAHPHWDLAKTYDIIDFELGNKITGSGFPVYKSKGAQLQRALISFFLDENINAGYTELLPPFMVNEDSGFGTGQLPDKEGQMYHIQSENYYMIPTAEVPVTNIYRDVILPVDGLPIKNTAYTPCFRREAGSYGKDVRGLNRLHQFDKVEIVQIQHPENSYEALEGMVQHVEKIIQKLELPYRILKLCGGDMGFTSALTYDFEVFAAAQDKWLEVSSVSNFESFQANRLKLRFREHGEKKSQLVHTLNGSALALPRIVAAILENYQSDAGIRIPQCLIPYTGFDTIY